MNEPESKGTPPPAEEADEECRELDEKEALLAGWDPARVSGSRATPPDAVETAGGRACPTESTWLRYEFGDGSRAASPLDLGRLADKNHKLAAAIASRLGVLVKRKVRVDSASTETCRYCEFTRDLPRPTSLHLIHSRHLGADLLVALSPRVLLAMLELLLGGDPARDLQPVAERPLTALEESLSRTVIDRLIDVYEETWKGEAELGLEHVESESNPMLVQIAELEAQVARSRFSIEVTGVRGDLHVAIPAGPLLEGLASLVAKEAAGRSGRSEAHGEAPADDVDLLATLSPLEIDVHVDFPTDPLPLRDLLGLRPGDVIDTGVSADSSIDLCVGGRRITRGRLGKAHDRFAVRLF